MKVYFVMFLFMANGALAQTHPSLSRQIDSLYEADQKWRKVLAQPVRLHIDPNSGKIIKNKLAATDSLNLIAIRNIFRKHGYPGFDMVGRTGSHNFWLLVQHQEKAKGFRDSVLVKMKEQVDKKNASAFDYAYMLDKMKVEDKALQVYGTQVRVNNDSTSYEPLPVLEPESLNVRRKAIGLSTIEDYIEMKNRGVFDAAQKK